MALKGLFPFFNGSLPGTNAYAVIDDVRVSKGGEANCHVSVYAGPPVDTTVLIDQVDEVTKLLGKVSVVQRERGPVPEHFTCAGVIVKGQDPFVAAYEQLAKLDERFKDMLSA